MFLESSKSKSKQKLEIHSGSPCFLVFSMNLKTQKNKGIQSPREYLAASESGDSEVVADSHPHPKVLVR